MRAVGRENGRHGASPSAAKSGWYARLVPGEHGGWSLSQGTAIICFCGERLFELADLKAAA